MFSNYMRISSLVMILLMMKNLVVLTSKFPALGVLFETISAAWVDLLNFTIITSVMIVSLSIMFYCVFGPNEKNFNSSSDSAMSMLQMLFGRDLYSELNRSNPRMADLFFIGYAICFYFVILNVYAAIVMRTYDNLRQ